MLEIWIGFAGGILVGSTGLGVGLLVTPLLVLAGHRPPVAVATGLGVLVASKLVGTLAHHGMGHWPPGRGVWILAVGGASGVILAWFLAGAWLGAGSPQFDVWMKHLLGVALLAAGLGLLLTNRNGRSWRVFDAEKRPTALFAVGFGAGIPVMLTSMGSGSLLVPALAMVTGWNVPQLAAASNFFGWVVGVLGVAAQAHLGYFDWRIFARVLVGLLPGVAAGVPLSRRIARRWFVYGAVAISVWLGIRLFLG